jgi:alkylation response protein AidB-like acyl-CoA dehydrogenase
MASPDEAKILSRRDLDFQLYEWLGAETLTSRPRYADHSRATFDAALDLAARLAAERFYPINKLLDREEPVMQGDRVVTPAPLKGALAAFAEAGLVAAGHDGDLGGMQLPHLVASACFAWFQGASCGAAAYPMLTMANANLLLAHASKDLVERYVPALLDGRWFGTMCLSEPQAGSSLADIRTRAVAQADGTYRLTGNKMWISGGEQDLSGNIIHLVLAKIPGPDGVLMPGTKGISLFLVPKLLPDGARNDVVVGGLNHKMGYRGTTNCLMNFGEGRYTPGGAAGAVGWLVGAPGEGLKCMFHMMNEARVGVGLGATMQGYTGYLHALDYARTRLQGRHPEGRDPARPQVPIIEHADVRRMLLAQKSYVEGALGLILYCTKLVDDERTGDDPQAAKDLLELLTPVAKAWPAQWCLEANALAIQVHGGYGYTRDFNVEQHYRDNRLNPIHEGTNGIQAIDLLGRKVRMNDGRLLQRFAAEVAKAASDAASAGTETARWAALVTQRLDEIRTLVPQVHSGGDANLALANAHAFLEAFGHLVVAWIWLQQATVAARALPQASGGEAGFYRGKLQAARWFLDVELPRIGPLLEQVRRGERSAFDMQDAWF